MKIRSKIGWAIAATVLMGLNAAMAANSIWTNTAGGEWTTPENWDAGIPGAAEFAYFTSPYFTSPFTVSFTNDAEAKLELGSVDPLKPVQVTFDLNGNTLTHSSGVLKAQRHLSWTIQDGTVWMNPATGVFSVGANTGDRVFLNIQSGGVLDARQSGNYIAVGNNGTGTVTVTGSGSQLLAPSSYHFYLNNTASTSDAKLIVEDGGLFKKAGGSQSFYIGYRSYASGQATVQSGGTLQWVGGAGGVRVGVSQYSDGKFTITGAGSYALVGELNAGQTYSTGIVTVADGGKLELFRTAYWGRTTTNVAYTGYAKLLVTGTNSIVRKTALTIAELPDATIAENISIGIGGGGFSGWTAQGLKYYSGYGEGGKGELVVENGGLVDVNAYISVYSNSTIKVDGGHVRGAYAGLETGSVFTAVLRLGDANNSEALITATNEVRLWGATLDVQLGSDFTYHYGDKYRLIGSDGAAFSVGIGFLDPLGNLLVDDTNVTLDGQNFYYSYDASSEIGYVTLTAIPEPGSLGLLGAGVGLSALLRRRRNRRM